MSLNVRGTYPTLFSGVSGSAYIFSGVSRSLLGAMWDSFLIQQCHVAQLATNPLSVN